MLITNSYTVLNIIKEIFEYAVKRLLSSFLPIDYEFIELHKNRKKYEKLFQAATFVNLEA